MAESPLPPDASPPPPPPRAFTQGVGLVFQFVGVILFLVMFFICCGSSLLSKDWATRSELTRIGWGQSSETHGVAYSAQRALSISVFAGVFFGMALAGVGLGMQAGSRIAAPGAVVMTAIGTVFWVIHTMFAEYIPRLFEPTLAQALFGARLGPGLNTVAGIAILVLSFSLLWIRPLWGLWVGMTVAVVLTAIKPLDRYFLEVLPLLVFAWWTGLRWMERRFSGRWVSITFITLFLLGATTNLLRVGEFILEQY